MILVPAPTRAAAASLLGSNCGIGRVRIARGVIPVVFAKLARKSCAGVELMNAVTYNASPIVGTEQNSSLCSMTGISDRPSFPYHRRSTTAAAGCPLISRTTTKYTPRIWASGPFNRHQSSPVICQLRFGGVARAARTVRNCRIQAPVAGKRPVLARSASGITSSKRVGSCGTMTNAEGSPIQGETSRPRSNG